MPNAMSSLTRVSSALMVAASHLVGSSLVHLAVDARDLVTVVLDIFLRLPVEVSEAGTNGLGHELHLVVPQDLVLDVVPLGAVYAGEVLETGVPLVGIISEETGELIDFALIGSPLSNPGSFVETIDELPCFEVVSHRCHQFHEEAQNEVNSLNSVK